MPAREKKVATDRGTHRMAHPNYLAVMIFAIGSVVTSGPSRADDPVFRIVFNDGNVTPLRIEVPANCRIEIQLVNEGKTPAEFESLPLRKEKVIAPGVTTDLVMKGLDPGEYPFFDDFHPHAQPAVLVAK
jgi:hypothetical protein